MSYYWAEFKRIDHDIFRFDTRIYLSDISFPEESDMCIGAIVGKNPGSAKASYLNESGLEQILLDGDKLLPTVRNIVLDSSSKCNFRGRKKRPVEVG